MWEVIESRLFGAILLAGYMVLALCLLYARVRLKERNAYLSSALLLAAQVFEHYAALHAAKGTPEADAKAGRNQREASCARDAVRKWGIDR